MRQRRAAFLHVIRHPAVVAALSVACVTLAMLAAVTVLIWQPAREEAEAADAKLEQVRAELRTLRSKVQLAQTYASRLPQVETLESKLRQSKSEPAFVHDVEALAAQSGALIEQVSSSGEEKSGGVNTALFELVLKGRYDNLRHFIAGIPDLNDFVAIERILMERDADAVRAFLVLKRRHRVE